jgi:hypothetical protein
MNKILSAALILSVSLIAVACVDMHPKDRPMPHFVYQQYPATQLNIGHIEVVEGYTMPMSHPNAEHLMPEPLPRSVGNWARNHYKANGGDGTLVITIKDASVTEKDLERTKGFKGVVTVDQSERYDAHILVDFNVTMTDGRTGSGQVDLHRGQSIAENASLEDRDKLWTSMEEKMLLDLDAGTQRMLQQKLGFLLQK